MPNKTNILLIATTSYAGMGPYVTEIVNSFSPDDPLYFFFLDYEDLFFQRNVKKELHSKSVFRVRANSSVNKLVDLITRRQAWHGELLQLCRKWDIHMVHFINGLGNKYLAKDFEGMGIANMATVHDLHPHEAKKAWHKMLRWKILNKRIIENLSITPNLITNSKSQYEELKIMYPDKKVYYHSFPSLVTKSIMDGHNVPTELKGMERPYILFFGRIEEYKGLAFLYDAFIKTPDLHENYSLVIAGKGDLPFERKVDNNVIIINRYIDDTEVGYLYRSARCVVYPYISATQSGVLSLAFYFKVPTLTSDVPFFRDIMCKVGVDNMFRAGDSEDLSAKLTSLLSKDCDEMCAREYDYYLKNYDRNAVRRELLAIYSSVCR